VVDSPLAEASMRSLPLLLVLVAPPPSPPEPALEATGAFFALSVPDLAASRRWYLEKLGLTVVMEPPKFGPSSVVVLEGGGLTVELIQRDDGISRERAAPAVTDPVQLHGIVKVGVLVADLERTLTVLRARHVPIAIGPFPARPGQRANFIIRDPDGNLIQFLGA
jgi:catechol 2,3-dioxygenase-like lactoylglutathione lyase family enzyme